MSGIFQDTFAGRKDDIVGLGFVRAVVNPRLLQSAERSQPPTATVQLPPAESVIEFSYGAQATPWLVIRPDIQYILDPGAFRLVSERGALVPGIQIKMQF